VRRRDALREGLATRELRLYVLACAAMSLALWAFTVVLAIAAYKAGGTGAVTLAVVARVMPGALAGPFTALLADRRSRRAVLLELTGGATAALGALTLVTALDGPFALVLVLAVVFSVLTSGQQPAQAALLPALARNPRQLAIANSLRTGFGNAAYCAGALAGGAAAAGLSLSAGFAVALAASAAAVLALVQTTPDPRPPHREARAGASVATELLLGLREVRAAPELRESVGLLAAIGLVYGVLDVLMVVVAFKLVGLGTGGVGILNSAWGAGGLVGGFAALSLLARGRFSAAMDAGAALIAAPLAIVAVAAAPVVAVLGFAVLGLGYAVAETAGQTLMQRLASDETLARAYAVGETGYQLAVAGGSVLAPLLTAALGIRGALLATALVFPAVVIARWRAVQRLDAQAIVPERELQALRAIDLFAPVALATVETLAVRALPRAVLADEQILRAGDIGSRFYVIADGSFEAHAGTFVRRLGPGDYFGEIALLRDVPRTAAVVATTDGLLYVLARDDFLGAVTGNVRSTQAAQTVTDARLRASASTRYGATSPP
jgi:MFS family permease